jgi:hypothetical protein
MLRALNSPATERGMPGPRDDRMFTASDITETLHRVGEHLAHRGSIGRSSSAADRRWPNARTEYNDADLGDAALDELERARRFWVRINQSFGRVTNDEAGWSLTVGKAAGGRQRYATGSDVSPTR